MLTQADLDFYDENGYLLVEDAVTPEQLKKLRQITHDFIKQSRQVTQSTDVFDLDEGHSAESPKLTRIKLPHKQDPYFWEVLQSSRITQVLHQILGESALLQTSKLNTKAPGGGAAVEWHQDWAFYPHTNDSLLACGLFLEDITEQNGPLQVIPGSHKGPVLDHRSASGVFCGAIDPDDPEFHREKAVTLTGKAGSMSVHHVRAVHGSAPNLSDRARLMLFYECAAADAWPLMGAGNYLQRLPQDAQWADVSDRVIYGTPSLTPRMEANPVRLPLPPASDVSSIFKVQTSGGAKSGF